MAIPELLLLHDGNLMVKGVVEILEQIAPVRQINVQADDPTPAGTANCRVVCVKYSTIRTFDTIARKHTITTDGSVFVIPSFSTDYADQLMKLGINYYLVAPVPGALLTSAVRAVRNRGVESGWLSLHPPLRDSLAASLRSFKRGMDEVRSGEHIDISDITNTCAKIAASAEEASLSNWLTAIKDHHDYTYRHCMFVCGAIVHFAHAIGIREDDLTLLSVGGMLHDIGKARVSLQILDQPARLNNVEQVTMRGHPSHSRDIMASMEGLDPRVVAMAVHHHEKLDGTGYPDGLKGAAIDDLVRLTWIADVFSALIDERAYKPSMSYEEAFAKMESMKSHLDLEMLVRFKEFAMDYRPEAA